MRRFIVILLLLAGAAFAGSATQPDSSDSGQPPFPGGPPKLVDRVYDIRVWLAPVRDYPLYPAPQATAPASQPAAGPAANPKADDLIQLIQSTIAPDTWGNNGASAGPIHEVDGKLYVTQTAEVQAQVAKLIEQVTADTKRGLHITATWLLLADDQLETLRNPPPAGGASALIVLNPQAMEKQRPTPFARAELDCINGQITHVIAGGGKVKLQVQPILTSDKEVLVDVLDVVGDDAAPPGKTAPATQPAAAAQQFQTTAHIPLGADVLIGGMTLQPGDPAQDPKQLYLVLRIDSAE